MKNLIYLSGIFMISIAVLSCSDDFLSGNKKDIYILPDTLFLTTGQTVVEETLQLGIPSNSDYTIFMQPRWLSFSSMHGKLINGSLALSFRIIEENIIPTGYRTQYCPIVIDVENTGLVSFVVAMTDYGHPQLQTSAYTLNYESTYSQTFTITNISTGLLNWQIAGAPDWVILSETSGSLDAGNSKIITVTLNSEKLTGQEMSGSFQINSNSVNSSQLTISLHVAVNNSLPESVNHIDGTVTDAEFSHESGIMVICTKSQPALIIYNTLTKQLHYMFLSRIPTCVSLSEDGTRAVVGYSEPVLSYINVPDWQILRDYTLDCVPFDVVMGENDWVYITPVDGQWVSFRSLNLNTGSITASLNTAMIYEKTVLRKINGKPYLVGTRSTLSPSGLMIFDITKGKASDTADYYHEDIRNFWISEDGSKLYGGNKNVYSLPEYDGQYHYSSPPIIGQIESSLYTVSGLDECPASNSFYLFSSYFDYPAENATLIEKYSISDLAKTGSLHVSPVVVTENSVTHNYESNPRYIFVNKEGTRLFSVNNVRESFQMNHWTIQTFQISK